MILSAYGWLPGGPNDPHHPLVKRLKIIGVITIILGFINFLVDTGP